MLISSKDKVHEFRPMCKIYTNEWINNKYKMNWGYISTYYIFEYLYSVVKYNVSGVKEHEFGAKWY